MRVEQLFDSDSHTFSYLVWDEDSQEAALIDPVRERAGRDAALIRERGLILKYTLETHVHADHVTAAGYLREALHSIVIVHENSRIKYADVLVKDGDFIPLGRQRIHVVHTPGHTDNHICFTIPGAVFAGDALLVNSCGGSGFQHGDVGTQYDSIIGKLYTLPEDTLVYPGHDYLGNNSSTIGDEKRHNPRISDHVSREEFVASMQDSGLDPHRQLREALTSNLYCGLPAPRAGQSPTSH